MNKAYIILAHKNPNQLLRLIQRLDDSRSFFFIHIDKQVDIANFHAITTYGTCVKMLNREATYWAGMGLVKATLNGLRLIKVQGNIGKVILLSGQDYPIKSNTQINDFLELTGQKNFIEHTALPNNERWKDSGGLYRVNKYYMGLKLHQRYTSKALNFASTLLPVLKRRKPKFLKPYAGSQWWVLDKQAVDFIVNYVESNPDYVRFHRYTFAPDEVFFHTILLNCQDECIRKNVVNTSLMHMNWTHQSASHPTILSETDIEALLASKQLFARKFEQETDMAVFDKLDIALQEVLYSEPK